MKKYTAKYYDKDGNLKAEKVIWAMNVFYAEVNALRFMGEHYSFVMFYRGNWVVSCQTTFCDVIKQNTKTIIRKSKRGDAYNLTLSTLYSEPLQITPSQ
jgi:hypothetical protein